MHSTLWFWIVILIFVLFVVWFIRRYLGRILLILLGLFVLFFIFKRLNPSGANAFLTWLKMIPVSTTNMVNTQLLGNDIVISNQEKSATAPEKSASKEEKPSWFARIFGKKSKTEGATSGNLEIHLQKEMISGSQLKEPKSLGILVSTGIVSQHTGLLFLGTGRDEGQKTDLGQDLQGRDEEEVAEDDEIIYLPSNPKPAIKTSSSSSNKRTSTPTRGLSEEDLREANAIFGF